MDEPKAYITLSALIAKLQAVMDEEGDLPVFGGGELGEFVLTDDILRVLPAYEPTHGTSWNKGKEVPYTIAGAPRRFVFDFA